MRISVILNLEIQSGSVLLLLLALASLNIPLSFPAFLENCRSQALTRTRTGGSILVSYQRTEDFSSQRCRWARKRFILTWARMGWSSWSWAVPSEPKWPGTKSGASRARERRVPGALSWGRLEHGTRTLPAAEEGEKSTKTASKTQGIVKRSS